MQKRRAPSAGNLQSILDLAELEQDVFQGESPENGWKRVYGGQVVAQALVAAYRTVENRQIHSLHSYFLRPGDPAMPIRYEVDRLRDGKSFTTRRVVARQKDEAIFAMSASFHKQESGFEHQVAMPKVPGPDDLPNEAELLGMLPEPMRRLFENDWPIEFRPVEYRWLLRPKKYKPRQHLWFRAKKRLTGGLAAQQAGLAHASDWGILETALAPHGIFLIDPAVQVASLDHLMWFHRPFRIDEWLLYALDSPSAQGARGFCRGSIFRTDGTLVASVAQEALMRPRTRR